MDKVEPSRLHRSKLSRLHRWILLTAYTHILEAGTIDPREFPHEGHLLRAEVFRDYYDLPMRQNETPSYRSPLFFIDTSYVSPAKSNAVHFALTRTSLTSRYEGGRERLPA
jgi:hypothetical protein